MKLIIAGGRDIYVSPEKIAELLAKYKLEPEEIVSGGATGVDTSAMVYAKSIKGKIAIFEADWAKNGRAAGPIRNLSMALYADALLLIWDGKSRGSASMKREMTKLSKPIYEVLKGDL